MTPTTEANPPPVDLSRNFRITFSAEKMKEDDYDGLLVRVAQDNGNLTIVLEPMDEAMSHRLANGVFALLFSGVNIDQIDIKGLHKNYGEAIWIKVTEGTSIVISGEWFADQEFSCASFQLVEREYDLQDLREKFTILAKAFTSYEEHSGKLLATHKNQEDSLQKYITRNRHTWTSKAQFFAAKGSPRAADFKAKLDVLAEIEKILKEGKAEP